MKWQDRFSSPERKRKYVRSLFATIADRYDLITILLSGGLDKGWKRRLVSKIPSPANARVLDLACGTGDIAFEAAGAGCRVVGLDITPRMVRLASLKPQPFRHRVSFVTGDFPFDVTLPGGTVLPVPGVSWVSVAVTHRRRGVLRALLTEQHRGFVEAGAAVSLLTASEGGIYGRFGYGVATRHRWVEIARRLSVSPGNASHHLKALAGAGLATARREGREVLYVRTPTGDALVG